MYLTEQAEKKHPSVKHQGRYKILWVCATYSRLCNLLAAAPRFTAQFSITYTTIFNHLHIVVLVDRGDIKEFICVKPAKSDCIPKKKNVYKLSFQFRKI